jgi:phospholipase A1/A2
MWIKTAFLLLWLLFISATTVAQPIVPVIGPPLGTPTAGSTLIFPVYYHNSDSRPITLIVPDQLTCHLRASNKTFETMAQRIEPADNQPVTVASQGYLKARFRLSLAPELEGHVQLMIPQISPTGLMLVIGQPTAPPENSDDRFSWTPRTSDRSMDALIELYQPYVKNISFYKPMFFLVGTNPKDSKFQVSFKYRFFDPDKSLATRYPWVQGFHMGYTQTSFWNLNSESAPFEDTSYKPELFFISPRIKTSFTSLTGLYIKTGLQHESNGRGGELSRSTNIAYIEPIFLFYNAHNRSGLKITPTVWFYFHNEDENNADLYDYRGYFNLGVTVGHADGLVIDANFQWAAKGPSMQLDATYPLDTLFFKNLNMYLQVNYTNQLAESLINYTEREQAVRIGFAIVR